jgi:hypothetical protein
MSVVPPAAKGTTILTGLLGQLDCARDGSAAKLLKPASARLRSKRRRGVEVLGMGFS